MNGRTIASKESENSANSQGSSIFNTESVASLYQRALALHQQNRFEEAEFLYRQILDSEPNHPGSLHFLGMVQYARKDYPEATRLIERSLNLCNTKAVYFNNYGVVLNDQKRYQDAKNAFETALILVPDYPDALSNLGLVATFLNEPNHLSEHYFRSALRLQPDHRDATRYLADLLLKNERYEEAVPLLEQQDGDEANNPEFHHRLGCVYGDCGQIEKAKYSFQKAASLPGGKAVWKWKHLWYCPTFFENEQQIEEYWKNLESDLDVALAERPLYDWRTLVYDGFTHSFNLPHLNHCCKDVLEKFAKLFAPSFPFERPTYTPGEKIRVGFLVTPGHEGGFIRLTTGLIDRLDSKKYEVILFYNETTKDRYDNKFKRSDLIHVPYTWNFEETVRTIREAKCDIIYYWKVGADVWNFFLPICRLAPIQCTTWSTHGTSGVPHVDYYVSWDKAESPHSKEHYTEQLYLFGIKPYYEPKLTDIPEPATRTELGLPETGAIYFCPHRPAKYHPMFDDYLRQILERDSTGHIVLRLGKPSPLTDRFATRIRQAIGDDLFRRIIIIPQQHVKEYYRYLSVSTVVLHSPIYSGEITSIDGFLYGVPSVTYKGQWLFQRYTSAFYDDFGITGPAVSSKNEYVEQAVKLGTDPDYRDKVSKQILANSHQFFENEQSIREWERFFETVTQRQSDGKLTVCDTKSLFSPAPTTAVPMEQLEINVAYECDLKCNYCSHFCNRMAGFADVEKLKSDFRTWHEKLSPKKIRLIGGEPLLHPKLGTIIHEVKKHWPNTRIDLVTNGLLFPKRSEILLLLKEIQGHVFISRHFEHLEYVKKFDVAIQCLKESGVGFTLYTSDQRWRKYYELDDNGIPIPYNSDPEKAWHNCRTKNFCPTLWENRLWKCQHLAWATRAVKEGKLSQLWRSACSCEPLSPKSTAKEILLHLSSESVPDCRICPESYEYISLSEKRPFYSTGDKPGFAAFE